MKIKAMTILALLSAVFFSCSSPSTAGLRTDALDSSLWEKSVWISAKDAPVVEGKIEDGARAADGASWFLAEPVNSAKLVSAKWMTSGLGVYDLYVNGKLVGKEILKPGFTHYEKTKRSFTYDVTDAFRKSAGASNAIAAQLTPGWWGDKIITPVGHTGMIGRKCAFRSVLELRYEDGSVDYFGTDTHNWLAGIAGPVKHAAIFDGEAFDAREKPGFQTPEKLGEPEINGEFEGEILPSCGAEVYLREDLALSPVSAYVWTDIENAGDSCYGKVVVRRHYKAPRRIVLKPGETLVVDFGQNCAAVPGFVFSARRGTELKCEMAEILNDGCGSFARGMDGPEGSVHRRNLRAPEAGMKLDYVFSGAGKEAFLPRCTFFGYRYISVTASARVVISKVRSVPVSSITGQMEIGRISTGNASVNRLISNTLWGERSNYLSIPSDCPQRNERMGWTADTQVFAETGSFFARTDDFLRKWMRDMRDTQSPLGGFPSVAPRAQYGSEPTNMMRVGWADAGVIVPWTIWKQYADTAIVNENWASMEKFISLVDRTRYDHTLLKGENGDFQWADWLSYEPLESRGGHDRNAIKGPDGARPEYVEYWNYLSANYWIMDAGMMRDMAEATGRDTSTYADMVRRAREYTRKEFINADGSFKNALFNTMQTPALFAIKNSLVEGDALEAMKARLRENFAAHGDCLQTGFLGTSILVEVLTENGMADVAYTLLFQRKNPSWLYSVDNGATTIWERWNSYTLENGMGPSGMNSFNHYAYGVVCGWLWKHAAGIAADRNCPGFKHIIMKPVPDRRLGHLDASYESAAGLITSSWKYEGDTWVWTFSIPEGASASVTIPGETSSKEYGAGTYTVLCTNRE